MLQFLKQILSDCELSMTYHLYSIRSIRMKVYYGLPSQRKTLLLFFGFFFLYIIIFFFLTRFLQNAWTDFHEIFRDGVYWSRKTENNFSCDDVTSGPRYWQFSNFQGFILFRYLLRNDSRYLLQIFTDDRQRTEVYKLWSTSL